MSLREAEEPFDDAGSDGIAVPLPAEEIFGRYRLCYELGSGGMATVYLARTEGPGGFTKAVALKRIHPHLVKRQSFVSMFLDEARIASLISHPNVCGAFDFGEVDGTYYIAMEYLTGEPLSQLGDALARAPALRDGDRWELIATRIAADVCEGLHAAHELRDERGVGLRIVHRDVSPQNVFVTYDGAVKLVDFGVAFARDRRTETVAGTIKGKIAYLAPEQLAVGNELDRRVDIWALGVTLWEMLAGRRLFAKRSDAATLAAIQSDDVPRIASVRPGVSPELDAIVAKALARDPSLRYQTARALGHDLSDLVVRRGKSVGLPQIAELMTELFPDRRPRKLEALSGVMDPSAVRRRATKSVAPGTVAATPSARASTPPARASMPPQPGDVHDAATALHVRPPVEATDVLTPTRGVRAPVATSSRIALWAGGLLAVAGLAAIGVAWAAVAHHDAEPAPPIVLPTPVAVPPATPATPATPTAYVPPVPPPPTQYVPPPTQYVPPTYVPPTPVAPANDAHPAQTGHRHPIAVHEAAGYGQVRFVCGVWADVREHGRTLGRTPTVARLRAGRHTVEFVASDGAHHTRTFDLAANDGPIVRCE